MAICARTTIHQATALWETTMATVCLVTIQIIAHIITELETATHTMPLVTVQATTTLASALKETKTITAILETHLQSAQP